MHSRHYSTNWETAFEWNCVERLRKAFFFFFFKEAKKSNMRKWVGTNQQPLSFPLSLAGLLSPASVNCCWTTEQDPFWVPCADVGLLRMAEVISPGRSWSLNSSWTDCSGLSCRRGSSSGRSTQVPPSLDGLSPPLAFSKGGKKRTAFHLSTP